MKKLQSNILICSIAALIATGSVIGIYFLSSSFSKSPTFNQTALKMFDNKIKDEEVFDISTFQDTKRMKYGSKLTLDDSSNVCYYELVNYTTLEEDMVNFAIAIKDQVVIKYQYLSFIDGHEVGVNLIDNDSAFVNYTKDSKKPDVFTDVTLTWNSMTKAIKVALDDSLTR